MATGPVSPADPGRDDDPARRPGEPGVPGGVSEGWRELPAPREDWLTEDEWAAQVSCAEPEWFGPGEDPGEEPGPVDPARPGAKGSSRPVKGSARAAKESARAVKGSRRGPGQPGSARRVPARGRLFSAHRAMPEPITTSGSVGS